MPYWNITGIANKTTDVFTLTREVNDQILAGYGGIGIQLMLGTVLTIAFMMITNDAPKTFLATGWFMAISGLFLWALGLVPVSWLVLCIGALAFSLLFYSRRE